LPRRIAKLIAALLVVLVAAIAGVYAAAGLAPERLRAEVERVLVQVTDGPVRIGSLRLVLGLPLHLDATDLEIWGGALSAERASARFAPFSLLTGRPRLARLVIEGAHFRIERDASGSWSPRVIAEIARPREEHPEPALAPFRIIDATVRFLLTKPLVADTLVVRNSRVSYVHDFTDEGGDVETLWFEEVDGRLRHTLLRGADLSLRTRATTAVGERGVVEWEGSRSRDGSMRLTMAGTSLELETLLPWLRGQRTGAALAGRLSGIADYRTPSGEEGSLDLDLVVNDLVMGGGDAESDAPVTASRAATRMHITIDPDHLEIAGARISSGDLTFGLDAVVGRPLGAGSNAGLTLSLVDVDLKRARTLIGWLPVRMRDEARWFADRVETGRVTHIEARGAASLGSWRELLEGRSESLPRGLRVVADAVDLGILVGESDRLDRVTGRLLWTGEKVAVETLRGDLNGAPLPLLDVELAGIDHLFASDPGRRLIASGATPLPGFEPLMAVLRPESGSEAGQPPTVLVTLEYLDHPALLWPLDDVLARIEPSQDGILIDVVNAQWAGVPLRGTFDTRFGGERRLVARVEAGVVPASPVAGPDPPPEFVADPAAPPVGDTLAWAKGRFEIGPITAAGWRQQSAHGDFEAVRGELVFDDLEIDLEPTGVVSGRATMDLSHADEVPFELYASLIGGDLGSLVEQAGFEEEVVTGALDLRGGLSGALAPDRSVFEGLDGDILLEASRGTIARSVPPVLALALASESLAVFGGRSDLRYARAVTALHFEDGRVSTEALELEGPDLRLFASGDIELVKEPNEIDAEIVVFLFRQIDRALGRIPIVSAILLGTNENLVAAFFELGGPWADPTASPRPLRTLTQGPGGEMITGIPKVVEQGIRALGGLLDTSSDDPPPVETPAPPPSDPASVSRLGAP
jgi:hypothetical protein